MSDLTIKSRRNGRYVDVSVEAGGTIINIGLLNEDELRALATRLAESIYDLCPQNWSGDNWVRSVIKESSIGDYLELDA